MKKKLLRRVPEGILTLAMMTGLLFVGIQPVTVQAEETAKTINLNTSYLAPSDGTWNEANDHKVYFGQYGGSPTAFRVLKADTDTMMLDCDTILLQKKFDEDGWSNTGQGRENVWKNSDLEIWLNGDEYYGNSSVFTSVERNAIVETALASDDYFTNAMDYEAEDYVYLLSATEADTLYDSAAARVKTGCAGSWWLRSGREDNYRYVGSRVNSVGVIGTCLVDTWNIAVSPVFNLNLSSVLFTSASGVSKSSDTLTQVTADSDTRAWKLTLSDIGKTVAVAGGGTVTRSGNTITVPYTYTGSDVSQISVMITNGAYDQAGTEILYYGKLNTALSASGTGTFTLPSGLPDGYKLYIMAEDVNDGNHTDYASAPVEIKAVEAVEAPTITAQPQNVTVQAGNSAAFRVAAAGTAPLTYQWMIDRNDGNGWVNISGAASDTYTSNVADMSCNGFQYRCVVSNEAGSVTSNPAALTVTQQTTDDPNPNDPNPDTPVPDKPGPDESNGDTPASDHAVSSGGNGTETSAGTSGEKDEEPNTGDDTPMIWLLVLLIASGAGLVFVTGKRYMVNSR